MSKLEVEDGARSYRSEEHPKQKSTHEYREVSSLTRTAARQNPETWHWLTHADDVTRCGRVGRRTVGHGPAWLPSVKIKQGSGVDLPL